MKHLLKTLFLLGALVLSWAPSAFAEDVQMGFSYDASADAVYRIHPSKGCLVTDEKSGDCQRLTHRIKPQVRIMVMGVEAKTSAVTSRYSMRHPFLIVDGINLTDVEKPMKSDDVKNPGFYEDCKNMNSPDGDIRPEGPAGDLLNGLLSLHYTPVLVQFTATTGSSLSLNAKIFAALLRYLSQTSAQKNYVGMTTWSTAGFNILGISQGGVIGRYGAYLYDTQRAGSGVPIRLFTSLDSPHQGAVIPRGLMATVDFWGRQRSKAEAKAFLDRLCSPGAKDLLLYTLTPRTFKPKYPNREFQLSGLISWSTSGSRWLFGEYRKAAEYQGFPSVLLSNGQLDGEMNFKNASLYYNLNRWSEKGGETWGRAWSKLNYTSSDNDVYAYNRSYKTNDHNVEAAQTGSTRWDMIQGSTYPFLNEIYTSFDAAFYDAIPDRDDICMQDSYFGCISEWRFYGKWAAREKQQDSATFIPTTSSLDLKCGGGLSVNNDCAFTQNSSGMDWENPGNRSTAKAIYAVDPSHPNSKNANSGRHVTGATATVDLWRLFCEVAKNDFDVSTGKFRNTDLEGNFDPKATCMNQSTISPWFLQTVAPQAFSQAYMFPWVRWTYTNVKSDKQFPVAFELPTGWQVAGLMDKGKTFEACDVIEVTVQTNSSFKGNWLRTEMVLSTSKAGAGWWQLSEQSVPVDGKPHTLRWQLPCGQSALTGYRWARLVMNSLGGGVTVKSVQIANSNLGVAAPEPISGTGIYPEYGTQWGLGSWGNHDLGYADSRGSGVALNMPNTGDGAYWYLDDYYDLAAYSSLKVTYWPSTCQATRVYFDKRDRKYDPTTGGYTGNAATLASGSVDGAFMVKTIPLSSIIDKQVTPLNTLSAQRLYFQSTAGAQSCIIKEITLQ